MTCHSIRQIAEAAVSTYVAEPDRGRQRAVDLTSGDEPAGRSAATDSDFFYALILTRTNAITAPVAIVNFLQYEGWEWAKIAASGTLVMFPVVIFTVLVRTYLVRGLTAGGIKD